MSDQHPIYLLAEKYFENSYCYPAGEEPILVRDFFHDQPHWLIKMCKLYLEEYEPYRHEIDFSDSYLEETTKFLKEIELEDQDPIYWMLQGEYFHFFIKDELKKLVD